MDWYFSINNERQGPVGLDKLKIMVNDGTLVRTDLVWNQSMGEKWSKVSDVLVLAGPQEQAQDPKAKEEFDKRIAERKSENARKKVKSVISSVMAVVVLVVIITAVTIWKKNAPYRLYDIADETPIGQYSALDAFFLDEYLMTKVEVDDWSHFVIPPSGQIYKYNRPEKERGGSVSAAGSVFMFVKDDDLVAILFDFPSAGYRGPQMINRCVVGMFAKKYWVLLGGKKKPAGFDQTVPITGSLMSRFDFRKVPKGHCEIMDKDSVIGLWLEHGLHHGNSSVYLKLKE